MGETLSRHRAHPRHAAFAITVAAADEVVGNIALVSDDWSTGVAEAMYWIAAAWRGRGFFYNVIEVTPFVLAYYDQSPLIYDRSVAGAPAEAAVSIERDRAAAAAYRSYWIRKSSMTPAASFGPFIQQLTQPVLGRTW